MFIQLQDHAHLKKAQEALEAAGIPFYSNASIQDHIVHVEIEQLFDSNTLETMEFEWRLDGLSEEEITRRQPLFYKVFDEMRASKNSFSITDDSFDALHWDIYEQAKKRIEVAASQP